MSPRDGSVRDVPNGGICQSGFPVKEHQSFVTVAQGDGFWRTDYKLCCPAECVNADQPGI